MRVSQSGFIILGLSLSLGFVAVLMIVLVLL